MATSTLRRIQPDAEITVGSVKVSLHSPLAHHSIQFSNDHLPLSLPPFPLAQQILSNLLDQVTTTVLQEASAISSGQETAELLGTSGLPSSSNQATTQQTTTTTSRRSGEKRMPLTSLDIHKALKRVLPGEPGELFRPYLPTVTKQAWHLDKQSLKGIKGKKQKTMMQAPPVTFADDDEDDQKTEQDVVGVPTTTEVEGANGLVTGDDNVA